LEAVKHRQAVVEDVGIADFSAADVRAGSLMFVSCRAPKFDTARHNAFKSNVAI